jgi:hypothetical protein
MPQWTGAYMPSSVGQLGSLLTKRQEPCPTMTRKQRRQLLLCRLRRRLVHAGIEPAANGWRASETACCSSACAPPSVALVAVGGEGEVHYRQAYRLPMHGCYGLASF